MKMPNYCYSHIRFEEINEAGKEKFRMLAKRVTEENNFSDMMQDGTIDKEEMYTRTWQHDNVGPKWTHIEDLDEDECTVSMNSAWSQPEDGARWLVAQIAEVDPNVVAFFTYQEEQPDFCGCDVFFGEEVFDAFEIDHEEIKELLESRVDGLSDMKDEDGDYTDEGWDTFGDHVSEVLDDKIYEFIESTLDLIKMEEKIDG